MASIGQTNLNNTDSAGPLKSADLSPYWPPRRGGVPYIAQGLDQQGRYPEAAHAATDIGTDDEGPGLAAATVWCTFAMLAIGALLAALWVALK